MRKAEREELQARVDAQAQEVFRDDASMKGFLNFMAQCTPQSTRNLLILYEQDPTITHPRTCLLYTSVPGSDKRFCFLLPPKGKTNRVAVYEAAIEPMAHLTLEGTTDRCV